MWFSIHGNSDFGISKQSNFNQIKEKSADVNSYCVLSVDSNHRSRVKTFKNVQLGDEEMETLK